MHSSPTSQETVPLLNLPSTGSGTGTVSATTALSHQRKRSVDVSPLALTPMRKQSIDGLDLQGTPLDLGAR